MTHTYKYPRPALTVDCVVFGIDEEALKVLLIRRGGQPFEGKWALPGGFVNVDEPLEEAARRELKEETGVSGLCLEQLYTFGEVLRDPRERVVSVAYCTLVNLRDHRVRAATDAREAAWFSASRTRGLAFDHDRILDMALRKLEEKVRYQPVGLELLPAKFKLSQLQHLYETILERQLDKRNFRRKFVKMGLLEACGETEKNVAHRAARLYCFNKKKYRKLTDRGFLFEM